jgi:hypothetical protein
MNVPDEHPPLTDGDHMHEGEEFLCFKCACGPCYRDDHVQCHKSRYCDGCDGHPYECA